MNGIKKYLKSRTGRITTVAAVAAIIAAAVAGCTSSGGTPSAVTNNNALSNTQLGVYNKTQPIPQFNYSQYRETLIQVEEAEANGVATTTFFYNYGSNTPVKSCPSIGYPIPSTSQLTSPDQPVWNNGGTNGEAGTSVGQLEPNGVYTGDSSGTYVVCVLPNGTKQIDYWEGDVETEGGPATVENGTIVDSGTSSVTLPKSTSAASTGK